jgi:membrane-bound lytic murein transglycosylase C
MNKLIFLSIFFISLNAIDYEKLMLSNLERYQKIIDTNLNYYQNILQKNYDKYSKIVGQKWGKDNILFSDKTKNIYYSKDLKERKSIDFKNEKLIIEIISDKKPSIQEFDKKIENLHNQKLEDTAKQDLMLNGINIKLTKKENNINQKIIPKQKIDKKSIKNKNLSNGENVYYIEIPLVKNSLQKLASLQIDNITKYSQKYNINIAYIMAIIHTESYFKPLSSSRVGALGLMQLVPTTGGRDAYNFLTGKDEIPSNEYLLNSENNIKLGTIYIKIIQERYLRGLKNKEKLYMATSTSYNAGIGTLKKSFKKEFIKNINEISKDKLYTHLTDKRYFIKEARNYVKKVKERTIFWKKELKKL